jgi:hypothetical protein
MRSWTPYLWKECRQNLWPALSALGAFLGIGLIPPIIDHIHRGSRRYDDDALLGIIELGGPILAVLVGVYAMGREQGTLERFWRSRPIDLTRWLLSKYAVGLAIVWLVCWIPLLIWMTLIRTVSTADVTLGGPARMLLVHSFILLLIYSASFVLGQCIRGTLHAAILSVGVMALILIMPLVARPLNWLSVELLERARIGALNAPSYIAFAATITVLSIALLSLAGVLLRRNVQVDVDQRTLSWSVVAILLVLAAGVAFPMGTNLPAQQVIPLPTGQDGWVHDMAADGNDVLILLSNGREPGSSRGRKHGFVHVRIGEQTSVVDEPLWFADPGQEQGYYYSTSGLAWSNENPSLAYTIVRRAKLEDRTGKERTQTLYTIALDTKRGNPVVHRVALNPLLETEDGVLTACLYRKCLYIYYDREDVRLLTFSLADPEAPAFVRREDLAHPIGFAGPGTLRSGFGPLRSSLQQYQIQLVPIPDLDDSTRLEITHRLVPYSWVPGGDDRVLASVPDSSRTAMQLTLFQAGPTQNDIIPLRSVAHRRARAFERLLRLSYAAELFSWDRLACRLSGFGATVYDIGGPNRIERIGHYAAGEGFSTMAPLPNNRVVIAGKRLHVLDLSDKLPQ